MKIETFEYIDNAVACLERDRDAFAKSAARIVAYLGNNLDADEIVGVTERIKTASSLREKIVRNDLYKQCAADQLIYHMSDIIGIRIECRFLGDERVVYNMLRELFINDAGDGNFHPDGKKNLCLKLGVPQPERQKNGLEIYRIDGFYVTLAGVRYNFELQIKSLVNSFWSEIEHKIIYKNKRYMIVDRFVSDLMMTIQKSLVNIDAQLNMLYERCMNNNVDEQMRQIENILTVLINDVYTQLIEEKVGFGVNIKDYSEALVKYILYYSSFKSNRNDSDELYGNTVMNVTNWMRNVDFDRIGIGERIELPDALPYASEYQRCVGELLMKNVNTDFYLNTFFHIFFSLEVGDNAQDFMSYVRYYETRTAAGASPARLVLLKDRVSRADPSKLVLEKTIEKIKE